MRKIPLQFFLVFFCCWHCKFLAVMQNHKVCKKDPLFLSLEGLQVFLEKSTLVQFTVFENCSKMFRKILENSEFFSEIFLIVQSNF